MTHQSPMNPQAAAQRLAAEVLRVIEEARGNRDGHVWLERIEVPVTDLKPLRWLLSQRQSARYYWSDRAGQFEMAGAGDADVLIPSGPQDLRALFELARGRLSMNHPSQRYYGGFRFYNRPNRGHKWKSFYQYRFIVPLVEVLRRKGGTFLCCNLKLGHASGLDDTRNRAIECIDSLVWSQSSPGPLPNFGDREDLPDHRAWNTMVGKALEAFAANELEKVVLARETTFKADAEIDPVLLVSHLAEETATAYEFCFQPVAGRAFLGASPERLYRRENCYLQSEALAGTRPRGGTDEEDERLAEDLRNSEKDLREHQFVVRNVRDSLSRFCTALKVEEGPGVMRLRNCQHLHTRVEGVLKANEADAPLLEELHPTAAVGGWPRDKALEWLTENEPFDRGVYAAPTGWIGFDAAEFCVAIRSGLVRSDELTLYSGAGIVPGSDAAEEWDEIENKLAGFLRILPHAG
ncbi:MAG: isochorismate synthase [Candidatus Hydrogenedens sp.]|nr:isochorismate synthase [Candidatus Hydrogenedens sp.]